MRLDKIKKIQEQLKKEEKEIILKAEKIEQEKKDKELKKEKVAFEKEVPEVIKKPKGKVIELKPKSFVRSIKSRLQEKFKANKNILIEMNYANGTIGYHLVTAQTHKFNFKGKSYIIDEDRKTFCTTSKMYLLRYHEGFSLPYEVVITSQQLKKSIKDNQEVKEITTSFNPSVLKDVLKFEYAKGVIQGAEIHEFIKRSFVVSIIILLAVIIHLGLNAYKSGWIG